MATKRFIVRLAAALMVPTLAGAAVALFAWADRHYPPLLPDTVKVSTEVLDRDGKLLRPFTTSDGRWRLSVDLAAVDPEYVALLVAYEDRRFWHHRGVDVLALVRAGWQLLRHGEVVSGGSTLTMQLTRLIDPPETRTLGYKLTQIFRALQLERRLSKKQILTAYLTLAPYGGNLEGIRAASLAWFAKEPASLSLEEAALMVALPQRPEARRPDRFPDRAQKARNRVLMRAVRDGRLGASEYDRVQTLPVPYLRRPLPRLAAHLTASAIRERPDLPIHQLSVQHDLQRVFEDRLRQWSERLPAKVTAAAVMADAETGGILASVGSAAQLSQPETGWIDMSRAVRSPGSTLKPLIYGLAFAEGIVAPHTIIWDRPMDFGGYRPRNFDSDYRGQVTVREALQRSLNVPAVQLLESVGPMRMTAALARAGVSIRLPGQAAPSLSVGLGGVGVTLVDLVQLYTLFPNQGRTQPLHWRLMPTLDNGGDQVLSPEPSRLVSDILGEIAPPPHAPRLAIGYKTGTSYGYRDAWAIGFDGRFVVGVWVGRPDNGAVPGSTGYGTAAPILFDLFNSVGIDLEPLPLPVGNLASENGADLPPSLRRFTAADELVTTSNSTPRPPQILYPPNNAAVDLVADSHGGFQPVAIKIQGGKPPFRFVINGIPGHRANRRRTAFFTPDGPGFSQLTVMDHLGQSSTVDISLVMQ